MGKRALLICLVLQLAIFAASGAARASEEEGEEHRRNHIAVVFGYSQKSGPKDKTGGKEAVGYGLEYQYRIHHRVALGVFYEQATGDFETETVGIPVSLFVTDRFKVLLAVASERELFGEEDELLWRVGLGYDFHIDHFSLSPTGWVDFVEDKEIYFVGLTVGIGF